MMSLVPNQINFTSHKENSYDSKTYILYRNGLFKTCRRGEAIELLKSGWYDKTKYQPKEEVLTYELQTKCTPIIDRTGTWNTRETRKEYDSSQRQHEERSSRSEPSCEREKSGHEQHQPNLCDDGGKEHLLQAIRPRQECSQVIKKRGRPKKVN